MFVDYNVLLLLNMAGGFLLLAGFIWRGLDEENTARWAPGFAIVGLIAFLLGLHMSATWPLPGAYNEPFGNLSVFLGAIFLGAAWAMARNLSPLIVAWYALPMGAAAITIGLRILDLKLTSNPPLSAAGFLLSGLGGLLAAPGYLLLRRYPALRWLASLAMFVAAALWLYVGLKSYWAHLEVFKTWVPLTMRGMETPH
jgi:putative membrane protein